MGLILRGSHVDATWQSGPRERLRGAEVTSGFIYIYYIYDL